MYKELAKQQTNINEMLAINYCLSGKLFSPFPFAVRSDSVRRPIRFRPPPDRIPSAVRLDSVRVTMTFREGLAAKIEELKMQSLEATATEIQIATAICNGYGRN